MKNKLFKTLVTFAVFAISVIGFSCIAHAADVEIIPSDDGNILKIHTETTGKLLYVRASLNKRDYKHIVVTGKMNYRDFLDLSSMTSDCKSLDLYGVEVDRIPDGLFHNIRELEKVVLPANLKIVGGYNFQDCLNLKTVILPENLEFIGLCSFQNCFDLQLTVPDNVSVAPYAFSGCSKVKFPKNEIIEDSEDEISESSNIKQKHSLCSYI